MTASTTPVSEKKAVPKFPTMNFTAYTGESAASICGWSMMPFTPQAPIAANQPIITGPKRPPTIPVPRRCTVNSATMMIDGDRHHPVLQPRTDHLHALHRGQHRDCRRDHAVTAEQGGAEHAQRRKHHRSATAARAIRRTSAMSAMMPPSPSLSACITNVT